MNGPQTQGLITSLLSGLSGKITGCGSGFPENIVSNHVLAEQLAKLDVETNHEWISERTGICERRIHQQTWDKMFANPSHNSSESETPFEPNTSLALTASQQALAMAGVKAEDIELILYATVTPDTIIPSSGCRLQRHLGAHQAWAMDINAACSGFVYALTIADQFIKSGHHKKILVVGADTLSTITNWKDRASCVLFGDGAGAFVVQPAENSDDSKILSYHHKSNPEYQDLIIIPEGGSSVPLIDGKVTTAGTKVHMRGREVYKLAVKFMCESAQKTLERAGLGLADVDWFIPHQANLRIIEGVAKRLKMPMERVLVNIDRFGNTSSGTIPSVFDENCKNGKIQKGQTVLIDAVGSGLTYGSLLFRF